MHEVDSVTLNIIANYFSLLVMARDMLLLWYTRNQNRFMARSQRKRV